MRRDRELVGWIGRLGAVEVSQVGKRFGVGRSVAYGLVARLSETGLLERLALLRVEPALIRATADGLRFAGLGLPVARVRLGELHHWIAVADVGIWAERAYGTENVISERELRFAEQLEGAIARAASSVSFRGDDPCSIARILSSTAQSVRQQSRSS